MGISINVYEAAVAQTDEKKVEGHAEAINQIVQVLNGLGEELRALNSRIDALQAMIPPVPPFPMSATLDV